MVSFIDVYRAAQRIESYVIRTPLERSAALSEACEAEIWLKLECLQRTGSFKLRGALNALLSLGQDERQRGVVTASAGNHGLGVARAAELVGMQATVVVAETASEAKLQALRRSRAELVLRGRDYDEAEAHALGLAEERGAAFISAYNHPAVIAGGGTVALEILEELPELDALVVPVGGGGLSAGIGLAAKAINSAVRVYGVQPTASPALHAALAAGRIVPVPVQDSLADGLAGNLEPGSITFDLVRRYVDRIELVEELDIAEAMGTLLEHEHLVVEGAGAVGLAALQRGLLPMKGRRVALVLSGRNVAPRVLRDLL